jgi:hypothetical protein
VGDRAAVLAQVRAAFPAVPIAAATFFDQRGTTYPDADPYLAQLDGRTWDEMDPVFAAKRVDALSFLDDAGLVAVLPLYLRLLLETAGSDRFVVDYTLLPLLTKPAKVESREGRRFATLIAALTPAQHAAVRAVLEQFTAELPNEGGPAITALDSYWR